MIIEWTVSYTFGKKVYGTYFMEEPIFLYLQARTEKYEDFPWYLLHGPRKEERQQRYLKRKLPVEARGCQVLGREGFKLELPFTFEQLKECDEEYLEDMALRIREQYRSGVITGQTNLLPLFPEKLVRNGKYMPIYFVPEIVEACLKIKGIQKKEARLVVFDGETGCSAYLLGLLGGQYNYLTFVTENLLTECEEEIEHLFEEYGLAVSVWEDAGTEEIPGDIFLDVSGMAKKYCRALPRGCILIDFFGMDDRRYLEGRMKESMLCQSFLFGKRGEEGQEAYPSQLLEAVCFEREQKPCFSRERLWEDYHRIAEEGVQILAINGEKIVSLS